MEANRAFLLLLARVLGPFTSTVPFFAAEVWFKFRKVLRKWKKKARNVPLAPKRRTAPLSVSWSNCLKPSLAQDPPQKNPRREEQAWPVRARACLRVHCRACQRVQFESKQLRSGNTATLASCVLQTSCGLCSFNLSGIFRRKRG